VEQSGTPKGHCCKSIDAVALHTCPRFVTFWKLLNSSEREVWAISKDLAQGAQENVKKAPPVTVIIIAPLFVKLNRHFNKEYLSESTTDDVGSDIIAEDSYWVESVSEWALTLKFWKRMLMRCCCDWEQLKPHEMFNAGVIEGSMRTRDRLIVTFIPQSSLNCCKTILPEELESELSQKIESEIWTFDTFWVLNAPPPLCKKVENASRILQLVIDPYWNKKESTAWMWRPPPLTNTLVDWGTPWAWHRVKFVDVTFTLPAWKMAIPPPRLYVLNEEAPQVVSTVAFEKALAKKSTSREGTRANTAPPAALLAPEAHDPDEVVEFDWKNEQL